ncbi:unnamed protein product [Tenebrio molitor]|nr:unnamed protein product [Tenebrio molitor]
MLSSAYKRCDIYAHRLINEDGRVPSVQIKTRVPFTLAISENGSNFAIMMF